VIALGDPAHAERARVERDPAPGEWFLTVDERGNAASDVDRRRGASWTEGNSARVLLDGAEYFRHLHDVLRRTRPGDWVYFTDWQGDPDQILVPDGTTIGELLAEIASRGVHVRGLLWRSHPRLASFSEEDNFSLSQRVNRAGGEVLLDQRVSRFGSHHQKLVVVIDGETLDGVAFEGGIDLCHGRRDSSEHLGDPQPADLDDEHYGDAPPWHDAQLEVAGPAVHDIAFSFAERWHDPAPLDSPTPWRRLLHRASAHPSELGPLAEDRIDGDRVGSHAVQVLRTYPRRRSRYPFALDGERSIARAYEKAFGRAGRLIYIEDQYLWSRDATRAMVAALRRVPRLQVVLVIPRFPDPGGAIAAPASSFGRERVLDCLFAAGGERVAVYDLENVDGTPIYVHSKLCVVDDVWMAVGSDNLNRRSWTHDSELSCAVIDAERDDREPADPAGRGEGARRLARDTRLRASGEHLGRPLGETDDLVDPDRWFTALRSAASELDLWHDDGCAGPRPAGHLRVHPRERVPRLARPVLHWMHAHLLDPDGRPQTLRRRHEF
jgi:phosphatidylserine/phosphatidylglycerophosphate/cardiolipin synthase-like enzyme